MLSPQVTGDAPRTESALWSSIIGGAIVVLVTDLLTSTLHVEDSLWSLGIPAVLMFLLALYIGRSHGCALGFNMAYIGVGITFGFFLDALICEEILHVGRNLWVFGPPLYAAIGIVPVTVGLLMGNRRRKVG